MIEPEEYLRRNTKVNFDTQCWAWTGPLNKSGNPTMRVMINDEERWVCVFKHMYILSNGPIGRQTRLVRSCNTPLCVNPDHYEVDDEVSDDIAALFGSAEPNDDAFQPYERHTW